MIVAWKNYTAEETFHPQLKANLGVVVSVPLILVQCEQLPYPFSFRKTF